VLGYGLAHFADSPASGDAAAQLAVGLEQLPVIPRSSP
jgi:hypothetical protein